MMTDRIFVIYENCGGPDQLVCGIYSTKEAAQKALQADVDNDHQYITEYVLSGDEFVEVPL
jgi:hypothetical protein